MIFLKFLRSAKYPIFFVVRSSPQASDFNWLNSSSLEASWPALDNLDSQVSVDFKSPKTSLESASLFEEVGTGCTKLTMSISLTSLFSLLYLAS